MIESVIVNVYEFMSKNRPEMFIKFVDSPSRPGDLLFSIVCKASLSSFSVTCPSQELQSFGVSVGVSIFRNSVCLLGSVC